MKLPSGTTALHARRSSDDTAYNGMRNAEHKPLASAAAERRLVNPPGPAPHTIAESSRADIDPSARHRATAGPSASVRTPVTGSREENDSSASSAPSRAMATEPASVDVSIIRTLPIISRRAEVGNQGDLAR